MLLNHRAYLAILIMTEIAHSDDQGFVKSRPLALRLGLAPRAFETVFQQLSKARLLKSGRSPYGGYRLARSADYAGPDHQGRVDRRPISVQNPTSKACENGPSRDWPRSNRPT